MPWGVHRSILSPSDKKIIENVQASCRELMERLNELDAFVTTLNTELDNRKQRGDTGEQPTTTT
jgi:hypothetical protein